MLRKGTLVHKRRQSRLRAMRVMFNRVYARVIAIALITATAFGVRSCVVGEKVTVCWPSVDDRVTQRTVSVASARGAVQLWINEPEAGGMIDRHALAHAADQGERTGSPDLHYVRWRGPTYPRVGDASIVNYVGLYYVLPSRRAPYPFNVGIVVPYWLITVGLGISIAPLVAGKVRGRFRFTGVRCTHCGYDLRGGHERCPECGAPTIAHS
jgi:hypothetical protein